MVPPRGQRSLQLALACLAILVSPRAVLGECAVSTETQFSEFTSGSASAIVRIPRVNHDRLVALLELQTSGGSLPRAREPPPIITRARSRFIQASCSSGVIRGQSLFWVMGSVSDCKPTTIVGSLLSHVSMCSGRTSCDIAEVANAVCRSLAAVRAAS